MGERRARAWTGGRRARTGRPGPGARESVLRPGPDWVCSDELPSTKTCSRPIAGMVDARPTGVPGAIGPGDRHRRRREVGPQVAVHHVLGAVRRLQRRAHAPGSREGEQQPADQAAGPGDQHRRGDGRRSRAAAGAGAGSGRAADLRRSGAQGDAATAGSPSGRGTTGVSVAATAAPVPAVEPQQERAGEQAEQGEHQQPGQRSSAARRSAARPPSPSAARPPRSWSTWACRRLRRLGRLRPRGPRSARHPRPAPVRRPGRSGPTAGTGSAGAQVGLAAPVSVGSPVGSSVGSSVGPATTAVRAVLTWATRLVRQRRVPAGEPADLVARHLARPGDVVEEGRPSAAARPCRPGSTGPRRPAGSAGRSGLSLEVRSTDRVTPSSLTAACVTPAVSEAVVGATNAPPVFCREAVGSRKRAASAASMMPMTSRAPGVLSRRLGDDVHPVLDGDQGAGELGDRQLAGQRVHALDRLEGVGQLLVEQREARERQRDLLVVGVDRHPPRVGLALR